MENKINAFTKMAIALGLVFRPLQQAVSSAPAFATFMQDLGWEPDDVPQPVQALGSSTSALIDVIRQSAEQGFTIESGMAIKSNVETLIQAIRNIEVAPASSIPARLQDDGFATLFPAQVIEYLLTTYLLRYHERTAFVLQALGVIKTRYIERQGNRPPYIHRSFDFGNLPKALHSPSLVLENAFGWGRPDFDFELFATIVESLLQGLGAEVRAEYLDSFLLNRIRNTDPFVYKDGQLERSSRLMFFERMRTNGDLLSARINLIKLPGNETQLPGFAVLPFFNGVNDFTMALCNGIEVTISSEMDFAGGIAIIVRPDEDIKLLTGFNQNDLASEAHAELKVKAGFTGEGTDPLILFGDKDDTRIECKGMNLAAGVAFSSNDKLELLSEFQLRNFKLFVNLKDGDGFIKKIIPVQNIEANTDLTIGISNQRGIYFSGSGGLEIAIPTHATIGPIEIQNATLQVKPQNGKINVSAGLGLKGTLGPLTVVVNNMGLQADLLFPPEKQFFDFSLGFKPPSGIGLSIDAGGIRGGGILNFNPDNGEYFGGLELEFRNLFSLKAFCIINTRMPDGSEGFSLLIIVTAEFSPIQLGFGFALNGVGGLLGLNRTARLDVLREGIKTNTLKSILFPENIVANISRIVSDIKQVFPPQTGHTLICPMGKITWATPAIITLELGILIEIPGSAFTILGVMKVVLPTEEEAILKVQVNFVGQIDFENRFINFDAILYDSRILTYTLTGTMAMRVAWSSGKKIFLVSMGGFHPSFKEIPADLQSMQRITLSLLSGNNPRITLQCYYALTANTLQFGAKAELYAEGGGFNIYGFVGFDALFQRKPLYFITDFAAGIALRRHTSVIMGIKVSGSLSGPTLWEVRGKASVSFFFFSVSVGFHAKWGLPLGAIAHGLVDLLTLLAREIEDTRNWKADLPGNNTLHVSIKKIDTGNDDIVVHPFGVLTFSERLVPLEVDIHKFGEQVPQSVKRFEIKPAGIDNEATKEDFAAANFIDMKDEEKLSRPSFEQMKSGFRLTGSAELQVPQQTVSKPVDYEFSYLRENRSQIVRDNIYQFPKAFFKTSTKAGPASRTPLSYGSNRVSVNAPEAVFVAEEQFVIAHTSDMTLYSEDLVAGSYTEAVQFYHELVQQQPELLGRIQILSQHELYLN